MDPLDLEWSEIGGHEAAEKHINAIRASRGLGNSEVPAELLQILEQSCKMFATDIPK